VPPPEPHPRAAPPADRRVPGIAWGLGIASVAPFVVATAGIALATDPALGLYAYVALVSYGACMLAFLGAVQAGLALRETPLPAARLAASAVAPALAWLSLAVGEGNGLLLMTAGHLAMLGYDIVAARRGWAPAWYPRLRWPLTGIVLGCLLAARQFGPP
jgi:hypothetical protein